MKKLLYISVTIFIFLNPLFSNEPFSELCIHFNGCDVMKANLLGKYYDVFNYGGGFGISTPIYFGRLMANTTIFENNSLINKTDNYYSVAATIEWDIPLELTKYFQFTLGLGVGNYFMFFPEKKEEGKTESEICLLGKAGFDINIFKFLSISCNYYKKEISTYHKIYLDEISAGFYFRFDTSKGFREFLK